jgi:hypothetical protein
MSTTNDSPCRMRTGSFMPWFEGYRNHHGDPVGQRNWGQGNGECAYGSTECSGPLEPAGPRKREGPKTLRGIGSRVSQHQLISQHWPSAPHLRTPLPSASSAPICGHSLIRVHPRPSAGTSLHLRHLRALLRLEPRISIRVRVGQRRFPGIIHVCVAKGEVGAFPMASRNLIVARIEIAVVRRMLRMLRCGLF